MNTITITCTWPDMHFHTHTVHRVSVHVIDVSKWLCVFQIWLGYHTGRLQVGSWCKKMAPALTPPRWLPGSYTQMRIFKILDFVYRVLYELVPDNAVGNIRYGHDRALPYSQLVVIPKNSIICAKHASVFVLNPGKVYHHFLIGSDTNDWTLNGSAPSISEQAIWHVTCLKNCWPWFYFRDVLCTCSTSMSLTFLFALQSAVND